MSSQVCGFAAGAVCENGYSKVRRKKMIVVKVAWRGVARIGSVCFGYNIHVHRRSGGARLVRCAAKSGRKRRGLIRWSACRAAGAETGRGSECSAVQGANRGSLRLGGVWASRCATRL